jgi:hypothetical protein
LSIDLEENLIFHVAKNVYVNVDVDELNDVLRTIEHTKVNEDDDIDDHQFNKDDYDGHDNDDEIEVEEEEEEEEDDNYD